MAESLSVAVPKRKHKSYDIKFKTRAVKTAKQSTISAASRDFNVDRKRIREWLNQESELLEFKNAGKSRSKRLKGAGRKPLDESMEEILFEWIVELRSRNLRVS